MMIMGKHNQIEGLLGAVPCATPARGTHARMHHLDQRGGPSNGVERVEHWRCARVTLVTQELGGARQPALSCALRVMCWLRWRGGGAMIMVPCQHENIAALVRHHGTACRLNRCSVFARDYKVIKRLMQRRARVGNGGAVACCHQVAKPRQCRAPVFWGAQSAVGEGQGLLPGVRRCGIWLETLCQSGRAGGTGNLARRIVFLVNGCLGCAFHVMQHLTAVATRREILRHPPGHVARGPVAGHQAQAAIGGHAKAAAMVRRKRFTMRAPGGSRAL